MKKLAGTGELGDMLSHRIDFAHLLVGPMKRLVANAKQWHPVRGGASNDLEDWVALLAEFASGATGVLESSKLASGRNESWRSLDFVEINGRERSFVFATGDWNKLQTGKAGGPGLETIEVPREFWKFPDRRVSWGAATRWSRSATIRHGNLSMRSVTTGRASPASMRERACRR